MIPFFYYYTYGFMGAILFPSYILIGIVLTIFLFIIRSVMMFKRREKYSYTLVCIQIIPVFAIAFFSSGENMEKFDWNYNYDARMNLINKIETGEIKPDNWKVQSWHFPPISNGGNEVFIHQDSITKKITATFYIDRGFLDHYSAFIYSSIPEEIKWFEDRYIKTKMTGNKRINDNWFRISE